MSNEKTKNKILSSAIKLFTLFVFSVASLTALENTRAFEFEKLVQIILEQLQHPKNPGDPDQLADELKKALTEVEKNKGWITSDVVASFREHVQKKPDQVKKLIRNFYYTCIKAKPGEKSGCKNLTQAVAQFAFKEKKKELGHVLNSIIKYKHETKLKGPSN